MPEEKKSRQKDVPSVEEISRVLEYLRNPRLMRLYRAVSSKSPSLESCDVVVRRGVSRTERGKGEYERHYIDIPKEVARIMGLTEGDVVQIRKYPKQRA